MMAVAIARYLTLDTTPLIGYIIGGGSNHGNENEKT